MSMALFAEKILSGRIYYKFSSLESYTVRLLAEARQANKERYGIASKRFDDQKSDLEIHIMGMRAEYAVAAALGAKPRWELSLGGDSNSGDLVLPDGRSCSVKYRNRQGWDFALQSDDKSSFREDIGVLVYPGDKKGILLLRGWLTRDEFLDRAKVVNYGHGPRAVVSPEEMSPFSSLLEEIVGKKSK
tara:strand:+ start:1178 stop:1741 length:564 start_codon:yes stop_codon:yes gene_type:complete